MKFRLRNTPLLASQAGRTGLFSFVKKYYIINNYLNIYILCILTFIWLALAPSTSPIFGVSTAEGQTAHNLEIIFQRGTPDTSLYQWGAAIAGVGDVNGDGYDDVAVGAFKDLGPPNMDTAKVYLFYGSSSMDTVPDLLISDWCSGTGGLSICGGDVNGDGISDVCITAAGKVYIHFGGTPPSINPDIKFGGRLYENYSVIATGDLNGDDTTDLIVGDFWNMNGDGHVNIYSGAAQFDTIPWLVIRGKEGEELGSAIQSGGDVNNDGIKDIAVGACTYGIVGLSAPGRVYIFHGGTMMDTVPDWWKDGSPGDQNFGLSNNTVAPLCADSIGYDRLWAGEYWYPGGYSSPDNNGLGWLFYGGNPMDSMPDYTNIGLTDSSLLGGWTSVLDKSRDFSNIVSGSYAGEGGYFGKGYYWVGNNPQDTVYDAWILGRFKGDWLTCRVASAGDVDSCGKSEIFFSNNCDTNRIVVICKYTGPNLVEGSPEECPLPGFASLYQNNPNPFKHATTLRYLLNESGYIRLIVYNIEGQSVKSLFNGLQQKGMHKVKWDGSNDRGFPVSSGIYFFRLEVDGKSYTKKMNVIR